MNRHADRRIRVLDTAVTCCLQDVQIKGVEHDRYNTSGACIIDIEIPPLARRAISTALEPHLDKQENANLNVPSQLRCGYVLYDDQEFDDIRNVHRSSTQIDLTIWSVKFSSAVVIPHQLRINRLSVVQTFDEKIDEPSC